jgi:hypothetical protein
MDRAYDKDQNDTQCSESGWLAMNTAHIECRWDFLLCPYDPGLE